jgi:hypothetical protein
VLRNAGWRRSDTRELGFQDVRLEGINDEIVEGVIVQLQKTGNRPHLVKELAAILSLSVKIVEQYVYRPATSSTVTNSTRSANPSAIISSRLSSYLKRQWTALAPCPLAKELETVHPRRTYFYLTTYPHQPIPDPANNPFLQQRAIISPSISSVASRSDEADSERRRELSPSPEVDLSSPEFEDSDMASPPTPTGSFSGRIEPVRSSRASSPPLEKDEKEFTQTARGMQKRRMSGDIQMGGVPSEMEGHPTRTMDNDALFGEGRNLNVTNTAVFVSSPAMKPSLSVNTLKRSHDDSNDLWARVESTMEWDMRSPENIELEELDDMFDDF